MLAGFSTVGRSEPPVQPIGELDTWHYWTTRKDKEGWQFDAGVSPLAHAAEAASRASGSREPVLLEPLTFQLRFGQSKAHLTAVYMRSYANFGRAVVYIDGQREAALRRHVIQQCYRQLCEKYFAREVANFTPTIGEAQTLACDTHTLTPEARRGR